MSISDSKTYNVVVDAGNDMTEVVLVNSRFEKVGEGLGRVEQDLPAGVYLVKTRLGESSIDRFISVPDQTSLIDTAEDTFASAQVPLLDLLTWSSDERQAESVLRLGPPNTNPGMATISVFVRDSPTDSAIDSISQRPLRRSESPPDLISLRDMDGGTVIVLKSSDADPSSQSIASIGAAYNLVITQGPVTGFTIGVPAGGYILQVRSRNINTVGMAVWAATGFDTRVYLERRMVSSVDSQGRPDRRRIADLSRASIVMVRPGEDITSGEAAECVRVVEMARTTLATERPIFPRDVLVQHLNQKFQYPMLGILGAHLLAMQSEPDTVLLKEVADNLESSVLPGNPDVAALHRLVGATDVPPIQSPPMLRASWSILASMASTDASVVASDSVAGWVGSRLSASRPWLIWHGTAKRGAAYDESQDADSVGAVIAALKRYAAGPTVGAMIAKSQSTESAISISGLTLTLVEAARKVKSSDTDVLTEISTRLNMPRSTVANTLLDLKIPE